MPQNITETPSSAGTIVAPASGDPVTDGSIVQGLQPIGNRLAHVQDLLEGGGLPLGEFPRLTALGMLHSQNILAANTNGFGAWAQTGITTPAWRQTAEADNLLYIPIHRFPHGGAGAGAIMTTARVWVNGGSGHAWPVQNLPTLQLWRRSAVSGAFTQEGSTATDASGSAAAYQSDHSISVTGLSLELHSSDELFMLLSGESGTNALMNQLKLLGAEIVTVVTRVAP